MFGRRDGSLSKNTLSRLLVGYCCQVRLEDTSRPILCGDVGAYLQRLIDDYNEEFEIKGSLLSVVI